ncbi:SoxR reducing system RseC family protein [Agarivorans sp. QJM3NY_33]|uniref:SoxR reducing system RseC family protein n=1 Tax=Agarivorans sp. QJM3NY_33 TaxID=3421432 RepID=UPI003D7C8AF4
MNLPNNSNLIIETAKVVALEQGYAVVECVSKSACGSCGSAEHCGNSSIAKAFPHRVHRLSVKLTEEVQVGEQIDLGLNAKNMLTSALLIYLVPLLCLIVGAGLGQFLFAQQSSNEWGVVLMALLSLGLGFVSVRLFAKRVSRQLQYRPKMLRRHR